MSEFVCFRMAGASWRMYRQFQSTGLIHFVGYDKRTGKAEYVYVDPDCVDKNNIYFFYSLHIYCFKYTCDDIDDLRMYDVKTRFNIDDELIRTSEFVTNTRILGFVVDNKLVAYDVVSRKHAIVCPDGYRYFKRKYWRDCEKFVPDLDYHKLTFTLT